MFCVYGKSTEGICVDVYKKKDMKNLVSMQYGITLINVSFDDASESLKELMESMIDEF